MDRNEAKQKFNEAKRLFGLKRYSDSLEMLNLLDACFPDDKNIMLARAQCWFQLNRPDKAKDLCEKMIAKFNDPKAQDLLNKLAQSKAAPPPPPPPTIPGADPLGNLGADPLASLGRDPLGSIGGIEGSGSALDDILGPGASSGATAPPHPPQYGPPPTSKKKKLLILVGVVVVLAVLLVPIFLAPPPEEAPAGGAGTDVSALPATPIQWYTDAMQGRSAAIQAGYPVITFVHDSGDESAKVEKEVFGDEMIMRRASKCINIKVLYNAEDPSLQFLNITSAPAVLITDPLGANQYYLGRGADITAGSINTAMAAMPAQMLTPGNLFAELKKAMGTYVLILLLLSPWTLYLALKIRGKLPYDIFSDDILSVGLVGIGLGLLFLLPCIGWIPAFLIIMKKYEASFVETLIWFGLQFAAAIVSNIITTLIVGASLAQYMPT